MNIYVKGPSDDVNNKINIKDVIYMASQLDAFIQVYEKNVRLKKEEDVIALQRLKEINQMLKQHRYQELFGVDTQLIDFDIEKTSFSDEELLAWEDFFTKNPY